MYGAGGGGGKNVLCTLPIRRNYNETNLFLVLRMKGVLAVNVQLKAGTTGHFSVPVLVLRVEFWEN